MVLRAVLDDLLDALLPARCPGCGRAGRVVCAGCAAALAPAADAPPPPPLVWWTACFSYAGVARELVARAKYRNERRFLAAGARDVARRLGAAPVRVDLVTWPPASATRLRAHGIDHGEMLARAVARAIGVPSVACLHREAGPPQTGLDARTRRRGPALRAAAGVAAAGGRNVLVVDDVATTGGTLAAAARVLRAHGAATVLAATIARTPAPGSVSRGSCIYSVTG